MSGKPFEVGKGGPPLEHLHEARGASRDEKQRFHGIRQLVHPPQQSLPGWMQGLAHLLPPSYVFEAMRAMLSGGAASGAKLAWGGGLAALYIVGACWFFTRIYRRAVRTGLLARYSAETLS